MSKFKLGDPVRVTNPERFMFDKAGEVTGIAEANDFPYVVQFEGVSTRYRDADLTLALSDTEQPRVWTLTIPAPHVKAVRKRKTGKLFQRKPWLNSNDRDHFRTVAPITKNWRLSASLLARNAKLPKGLSRVRIDAVIIKPRAGRYDAMNYYPTLKAIVDGLTDHGLTADDSNQYVEGPYITAGGKGPDAVELTIKEIQ